MKVLIVENEIYLAQNMAIKLAEYGYSCEIATTIKDALKFEKMDVVLLSTGLIGQDFYPIIQKQQGAIIILLITYISSDTVSNPIKAGATDYIQKPFMIEELVRKIKLFERYAKFETLNKTYETIISSLFKSYKLPKYDLKKLKLPLLIISKKRQYADNAVFSYAKNASIAYTQISATDEAFLNEIRTQKSNTLLYITDFETLSNAQKSHALAAINKNKTIITSTSECEIDGFAKFHINIDTSGFGGDVLSIDEYVRHIIAGYQDIFTDTELAKVLGISRKSLWERRRRYEIDRKK